MELCFENIMYYCPSALLSYKTNFGKPCESPTKEADEGPGACQAWVLTMPKGLMEERQGLLRGNKMRTWLPWEWEGNCLLEKQHEETTNQT